MDFVTKLPISRDYDSILVVCDRFSKMLHFIVTTAKIIAKGLAKLFRDNVWKLYGFKVINSFLSTDKQAMGRGLVSDSELKEALWTYEW